MPQSITLNLPYDLPDGDWQEVMQVFASMDGWLGSADLARWFGQEGDPACLWASLEPGGLLIEGELPPEVWAGWLTVLCARLTLALGREVYDAEM